MSPPCCRLQHITAASPVQPADSDSARSSFGPVKSRSKNRHGSKIFALKPKSHTVLSAERKAEGIFMKGTAPAFACDNALASSAGNAARTNSRSERETQWPHVLSKFLDVEVIFQEDFLLSMTQSMINEP